MSCVAFFIAMFEVKNSLILRTEELGWMALQLKLNIYIYIWEKLMQCLLINGGGLGPMHLNNF